MPAELLGPKGKYKYIVTVIDVYTKYAWAIQIKKKTGQELKEAFEKKFTTSNRKPLQLWCDKGTEYFNHVFKSFLKQHNITLYSTESEIKGGVIERFNRTLKEKMWKHFTLQGHQKWFSLLPTLLEEYNNTKHKTIKTSPTYASEHPESIYNIVKKNNNENVNKLSKNQKKPKFSVGDRVRIYKYKYKFTKGFVAKWTDEIFLIKNVLPTLPPTYELVDLNGEDITGSFYADELQASRF